MAFDQSTRNRLARFVSDARRILTDEFTRQCKQDYGIDPDTGEVSDIARLTHLNDTQRATARILRETLDHYVAGSPSGGKKASIDRIIREQAFTTLNRLCAVRMAEARGIVIESVGRGPQSKGFALYARVAGSALGETADAYRCYLFSIFDEIALDLPPLFDRFSPKGRLFPSATALDSLLAEINHVDLDPLWGEDETIGWLYQYFNSQEERKQMRDESAAPRNSRELAVRNQFFTPRYVVEFLTDNTLGRIWYEMAKGETALKDTCRYLVRRPSEIFLAEGQEAPAQDQSTENLSQEELLRQPVHIPHRPLKDPREIRLLDPACGSMHFGLYAFDLFTTIYDEAWELARGPADARSQSPAFADFIAFAATFKDKTAFVREVPRLIIEHNIHGIDIDPRAVQIAGLSLWLRAQRAWHQSGVKPADRPRITRSHIVCAEPMPGEKALLQEFVQQQFQESERPAFGFLLDQVFDQMRLAGEAGSLLRIEEGIRTSIAEAKRRWREGPKYEQSPLFPEAVAKSAQGQMRLDLWGITDEQFWERAEQRIYEALRAYSEKAENGGGFQRRLFANDAAQGFAFIDLCRKRYDVAVMNPPFGEAARASKEYITGNYAHSAADILHAFVERGLSWLNAHGRVGVISARTGFFLGDSKHWRRNVVFTNQLTCFADLGLGVLDDALVEVAAYTIERCTPSGGLVFTNRQLDTRDKQIGLLGAIQTTATGGTVGLGVFDQSLLDIIPDHTFAYWAPASLLRRYAEEGRFASAVARVRQGVATADDFRFARLGWEVAATTIGRERRWQRFSKGGEYSPPYDDVHLLVDWGNDGAQIKAYVCQQYPYLNGNWSFVVKNSGLYFKPGATFTVRTASAFAAKILPKDCVFSHNAQCWFTDSADKTLLSIGYLSCRVPQTFLELAVGSGDIATAGSAARRYTTAVVESVPAGVMALVNTADNLYAIKCLYSFRIAAFMSDESSCHFCLLHMTRGDRNLRAAAAARERDFVRRAVEALEQSKQLDDSVTCSFALSLDEVAFVDNEVGPHPASYSGSASREEVVRLFGLDEEALMAEAVARHGSKRWFTKKSYFVDRRLEIICHLLAISPRTAMTLLGDYSPMRGLVSLAKNIVSEAVGCAFGRWDIRYATGDLSPPVVGDPFAPLPACPPGMLQNESGMPSTHADIPANYPVTVPWDGVLVDDPTHPLDIENSVRKVFEIVWPGSAEGAKAEAIEQQICELLNVRTLRGYLRKASAFFADCVSRCSKSRRQAPLYWPLSTSSGSYTLWLYYHRLTDQTLFKTVNDFVEPKLQQIASQATALRARATRSSADNAELERLSDFEIELTEFRDELLRLAKVWKPNLNDGVVITAAPLWKLFQYKPWQKKLKETWEGLEAGEYDWAHLAFSLWPDRVREKCKHDKSLAIAHGLEELYQEPPAAAGKKRGRKPKVADPELMEDAE